MAKKKKGPEKEPPLPKFGGFNQLAGLSEFKKAVEKEEAKSPARPAPPPPPKKVEKTTTAEDELTFHRMMSGVVPLGETGASRVPKTAEVKKAPKIDFQAKAKSEAEEVRAHLADLTGDPVRFEVTDDGRFVEGRRNDVPPSVLRTLRRGLLPIDARLDLHGLRAEEAREKVLGFLRDTRQRGERCVLVIHGKGAHSAGGTGILRGEMAAWLSQGRARDHVAAFATAREEDGGEGAVYVALRRSF